MISKPGKRKRKAAVFVSLEHEERQLVKEAAENDCRSVSGWIRQLIRKELCLDIRGDAIQISADAIQISADATRTLKERIEF